MNKVLIKLKLISDCCRKHNEYCDYCSYFTDKENFITCKIQNVINYMKDLNPEEWDFKEIEELLK